MSADNLDYLWDTYTHRFLAEGVHYRDMMDIRGEIASMDQWCSVWSAWGNQAEERADRALDAGLTRTAATELARASTYYFFAQYLLWDDAESKRAAHGNCVRTFRRAAQYLDPPQRPVDIPYGDITLPGYLTLPTGARKPPLVVLLGGLDTTKEEQLVINRLCAERGLATLTFDGPGQGETFARAKLTPDFGDAVGAVLDFAEKLAEIDGQRLGIIGRGLGGFYAPRAAALDGRVKAAVAWGAMYHLRNYASMPELTQAGFLYVTGSESLEDARPYFESVDLDRIASRITCPLMIVHGGLDRITPTENATMMRDAAQGPTELLFWEDSIHCAHDRSHICRPAMADFMGKWLTA